jgi:hypothetical protein
VTRRLTTEEQLARTRRADGVREKIRAREQLTLEDVTDAAEPSDIVVALNEGLLTDLGYTPSRKNR